MIRRIPSFIMHNLEKGKLKGSFPGFVLYLDLVNFTPTCDSLQKEGKQGAEEIGRMLQTVFEQPLALVAKHGGYVMNFVGDGFLALFKENDGLNVLAAALAIREHFTHNVSFASIFGTYPVKVRQLVNFGKISWLIYQNDLQNEYLFRGRTITAVQELAKRRRGLVFTEEAIWKIGRLHFYIKGRYLEPHKDGFTATPHELKYNYIIRTAEKFLHKRFRGTTPANDIRQVVCCVVNMEAILHEQRSEVVAKLQFLSAKHDGFLHKVLQSSTGTLFYVVFGMPFREGDCYLNACHFACEAIKKEPQLALGIAGGTLYTGYIGSARTREYTALGHPVNLAARLVETARPGEIITAADVLRNAGRTFVFQHRSTVKIKGVETALKTYQMIKILAGLAPDRPPKLVGRETEKIILRQFIMSGISEGRNTAIYVSGEKGVGKTRLVTEVLKRLPKNNCQVLSLQCVYQRNKPLPPDPKFMRDIFGIPDPNRFGLNSDKFHKGFAIWAGDNADLQSLEPHIAALLGINRKPHEQEKPPTPAELKQRQTAWVAFMHEQANRKHFVIHFDDAQWLGQGAEEYLLALINSGIKSLIVILSYDRYENEERLHPQLENFAYNELDLHPLSVDNSLKLYMTVLGFSRLGDQTQAEIKASTHGIPGQIIKVCEGMMRAGLVSPDGNFLLDKVTGNIAGVLDILSQHIDRLDEKTRLCLTTASVLGMKVNTQVLTEMLGYYPQEGLSVGVAKRIWVKDNDDHYSFIHAVNHETVFRKLMSDKLAELHLKAAIAYEKVYKGRLDVVAEQLALHYEQAGFPDKAALYRNL